MKHPSWRTGDQDDEKGDMYSGQLRESVKSVKSQNESKTTLLHCVTFPQGCSAILEQGHRGLFYLELGSCEEGKTGQMC